MLGIAIFLEHSQIACLYNIFFLTFKYTQNVINSKPLMTLYAKQRLGDMGKSINQSNSFGKL